MLAFLGGTGHEGRGLALRYGKMGNQIAIGSREEDKAASVAKDLNRLLPRSCIIGVGNREAACLGNVVFLTAPYVAQSILLPQVKSLLADKVVISVVAPMVFNKGVAQMLPVDEGSAAEAIQALLPESYVVSAFQNLSAEKLLDIERNIEGDIVICSDHGDAKEYVKGLVRLVENLRPIDGGSLGNSRYVECLTALLVNINRVNKVDSTVKIVGL